MATIRCALRIFARNQKRFLSTPPPSSSNISPNIPKHLQRAYEKFQRDDGVPVYIKGGPADKALFGLTVFIIAIGLVNCAYTFIKLDRKN